MGAAPSAKAPSSGPVPAPAPALAERTIKSLSDRGMGFIADESGRQLVFVQQALTGVRYEELKVGMKVTFEETAGARGRGPTTCACADS